MRTLLYLGLTAILFACGCDKSPPKKLGSLEIVARAPQASNVYIKLWIDGDCIGNYPNKQLVLHPTLGLHTRFVRLEKSHPAMVVGRFLQQIQLNSRLPFLAMILLSRLCFFSLRPDDK